MHLTECSTVIAKRAKNSASIHHHNHFEHSFTVYIQQLTLTTKNSLRYNSQRPAVSESVRILSDTNMYDKHCLGL